MTSSKLVTNGVRIHAREVPEGVAQKPQISSVPTFITQANASLRKSFAFQIRNYQTNVCIITFPVLICLLLLGLQEGVNKLLDVPRFKCGCQKQNVNGSVAELCGLQYTTNITQARFCQIDHPSAWPALMQVPWPYRGAINATQQLSNKFRHPAILYTGDYPQTAAAMADQLLQHDVHKKGEDSLMYYSKVVTGSSKPLGETLLYEKAFIKDDLYVLQRENCSKYEHFQQFVYKVADQEVPANTTYRCLQTFLSESSSVEDMNSKIYHAAQARIKTRDSQDNDFVTAYDFHDTSVDDLIFNVSVYYNAYRKHSFTRADYYRVSRPMNVAAQAFLRLLAGPKAWRLSLWFVKEMPRGGSQLTLDFSTLLGPLFYTWVSALLFPVVVTTLVYEKQKNLRMMMKMHGLGDGPYWVMTYGYFLALSLLYFAAFVALGSAVDLNFFRLNTYSIQFVLFFIYMNLQIALSFITATLFQNSRTATVCCYIYVFGSGLLGQYFFSFYLEDKDVSRSWIFSLELLPAFSLYRGLYEIQDYATMANTLGIRGMQWENLNEEKNGLKTVFVIQSVEWFVFLVIAVYLDQVMLASGSGMRRHPLFFLGFTRARGDKPGSRALFHRALSRSRSRSQRNVNMESPDVLAERERVEQLRNITDEPHAIVCENLKKVYPGKDGNPDKYAVRGVSLAVAKGECFGMLGPNGAGKSTTINMMTGLIYPTSGSAYIYGLDIRKDMRKIYTSMGVCPQHDLLWEQLTGREHLLFYGRLKNLKGSALSKAVDASLKSVNLSNGGIPDKRVKEYSGGMKRRLSVAISLIGDPKVVYMDEPGTGLDPGSRSRLWKVVKEAKKDRAIILTTHSMEEAEALCDRLCIFVNGQLRCIGDSKELTSRYGDVAYVLTVTTPEKQEQDVIDLVKKLSCNAEWIERLDGTQKFRIPREEVEIRQIFSAMVDAKEKLGIKSWGISDATLEDVFIKVARRAQEEDGEWT
ncbi:hypothetical protein R1flu_025718 [Riccia fluitans]|uniref:ABC transporter domain-containing protein n=1 Tax=Riccia fluitans TaxID=41844 RepID=A0ABD1Y1I5_9MARC